MNKIKDFFDKKVVIIVEGVIIALSAAGLFTGSLENIPEIIRKICTSVGGVLASLEALITVIQGITKKSEE